MSRILDTLRGTTQQDSIQVTDDFRKDVKWFLDYATKSNARILLNPKRTELVIECDACPKGGGGASPTHFYDTVFPTQVQHSFHISQLEALNVLIALKTLIPESLTNARVVVSTDNSATMHVLNSGKSKDPIIAACAREVWLIAATRNIDILLTHVPGISLVLVDALSRRSFDPNLNALATSLVNEMRLRRAKPVLITNVLSDL